MLYKLQKAFYSRGALLLFFLIPFFLPVFSQDTGYIRPPVTSKLKIYKKQIKKDSLGKMVELKSLIPNIVYDLRYATTNNFMRRMMYPAGTNYTFLRHPAADSLKEAQKELNSMGLGLKIFDAYRPYSVTVEFWELVKDERYVAHPAKGSGHNRGAAVDITIMNLVTGNELDMGTGFDNFSDTAHHSFSKLPEEVLQNRILLKTTMEKYGFRAYNDEWWHYSFPGAARFEILDIGFKKLAKNYNGITRVTESVLIAP
ncbi:MAG: M15 family metallopeptidase [Bacteroidetes bacterium]|nr:M15 family metallopeptidase [Bacteroidota bacterium]